MWAGLETNFCRICEGAMELLGTGDYIRFKKRRLHEMQTHRFKTEQWKPPGSWYHPLPVIELSFTNSCNPLKSWTSPHSVIGLD